MTPGSAEDNAADFPDRPPTARAESLVGRQSRHLTDTTDRDQALEKAPSLIEREPALVDSAWTLSALAATEVEF
ncbi:MULTISPECIES: hypothetical protein [Streptomyces]|uniref:hypothetical protein n=1 Tax=Streptomyces TaxID=1883 RepID=UPI0036A731C7